MADIRNLVNELPAAFEKWVTPPHSNYTRDIFKRLVYGGGVKLEEGEAKECLQIRGRFVRFGYDDDGLWVQIDRDSVPNINCLENMLKIPESFSGATKNRKKMYVSIIDKGRVDRHQFCSDIIFVRYKIKKRRVGSKEIRDAFCYVFKPIFAAIMKN